MAPTPSDAQPSAAPVDSPTPTNSWSTGAIVVAAVFGFILVCLIATAITFCIRKRKARSKLPPQHQRPSYHPFRTVSSDRKGLLENQAPSPDEDKTTMFSRDRSRSSVSLYVPAEVMERRPSLEQVSLIPLHVTPAEEVQDPVSAAGSNGSGVSKSSKGSRISLGLSPVHTNDNSTSVPKTRPRSTSTTSVRYYSGTSSDNSSIPQIPKIVHTASG